MFIVVLGIVGSVASIIGLYALYDAVRNRRVKLLAYDVSPPLPLATASTVEDDADVRLSIHYRRGDGPEAEIDAAFARYVRFSNFGKEPIRRDDLAPAAPLTLSVVGGQVLDIAVVSTRREVNQVELTDRVLADDGGSARIVFDYLDHRDGGVLRVLTSSRAVTVDVSGEVIGMPSGIVNLRSKPKRGAWGVLGIVLFVLAEVASFGLAAYVVWLTTGDWTDSWLLLLPLPAFVIPILLMFLVDSIRPEARRWSFSKELAWPLSQLHEARMHREEMGVGFYIG